MPFDNNRVVGNNFPRVQIVSSNYCAQWIVTSHSLEPPYLRVQSTMEGTNEISVIKWNGAWQTIIWFSGHRRSVK